MVLNGEQRLFEKSLKPGSGQVNYHCEGCIIWLLLFSCVDSVFVFQLYENRPILQLRVFLCSDPRVITQYAL